MTATAATATPRPVAQEIPLANIEESPFNQRKAYKQIEELAESIKAKGILVPVMVRPVKVGKFQLVAGHRRCRAAKLAELSVVPAVVRELSDEEVIEIQIIENVQRSDVTPLEEAEAYSMLMSKHKRTAEDIAARVGKTASYVYQRLKLADLPKDAKDAVSAGEMEISVALAIARLPGAEARKQAAAEIMRMREVYSPAIGGHTKARMTSSEAVAFVKAKFTLRLNGCGFDLVSEDLVKKAGACAKCPKRSINSPQLFPDLASKEDLCTDPVCFEAKQDASWKLQAEMAKAKGVKVLSDKEANAVFNDYGHEVKYGSDLAPLEGRAGSEITGDYSSDKTLKSVMGATLLKELQPTLARAPDGTVVQLVSKAEATSLLVKAGKIKKPARDRYGNSESDNARLKREKAKRTAEEAASGEAIRTIARKAAEAGATSDFWRVFLTADLPAYGGAPDWLRERVPNVAEQLQGLKGGARDKKERELAAAFIATADPKTLVQVAVETELLNSISNWHPISDKVEAWAKAYKLDLKKLREAKLAELKAAEKEKAKAKGKKKLSKMADTIRPEHEDEEDPTDEDGE